MHGYWYLNGELHEFPFPTPGFYSHTISIPANAQVWVPKQLGTWHQVNARSRVVPVPKGVCNELRAALLLSNIHCWD